MRGRTSRGEGLTIVELLVACGLLAVVLVIVMTLFGQLMRNTEKNALLSAATYFADVVMEEQIGTATDVVRNASNNAMPAFPQPTIEGEGLLSTADIEARTKFLYRIDVERMDIGAATAPGQFWFMKVEVRWWSNDMTATSASRAGHGNLSLKQSRMVYIPRPR